MNYKIYEACRRAESAVQILDSEDNTKEQELIEDLMQIITIFSCRLHGKRANKTKQIMEQLVSLSKEDTNE